MTTESAVSVVVHGNSMGGILILAVIKAGALCMVHPFVNRKLVLKCIMLVLWGLPLTVTMPQMCVLVRLPYW